MKLSNGSRLSRKQVLTSELKFVSLGFIYYTGYGSIKICVQEDPLNGVYLTSCNDYSPYLVWDSLDAIREEFKERGFNVNYDYV